MGPKARRVTAGSLKQSAFRDFLEQGADLVQIMALTGLTPAGVEPYLRILGRPVAAQGTPTSCDAPPVRG